MEELLKRIKRFFIESNKRSILKNYYSKEMRKGKTYRASFLDKSLFVILTFIILLIILIIKSDKLILSLYISGLTVFFVFSLIKLLLDRRKKTKINDINENLKKRRLVRDLSHMNKDEFTYYVKDLLEEIYDTDIELGEQPLDLVFTDDNITYGVKCYKITMEDKVRLRDLEVFQGELNMKGIDKGIVFTNSYFRDQVEEDSELILYDLDKIIGTLKELGEYPSDKEIEDYILDRYTHNTKNIKEEIKSIGIKRILQLYGMFGILYFLSFFINYPIFYKVISIFSFIIATAISGYKISEYIIAKDR